MLRRDVANDLDILPVRELLQLLAGRRTSCSGVIALSRSKRADCSAPCCARRVRTSCRNVLSRSAMTASEKRQDAHQLAVDLSAPVGDVVHETLRVRQRQPRPQHGFPEVVVTPGHD